MKNYDITFMGHMTFDEVVPYNGDNIVGCGGIMLLSSSVSVRLGKKTAVIVKMAEKDRHILKELQELGADTYVIPSNNTTYVKLIYPTADTSKREFVIDKSAGTIKAQEVPDVKSEYLHLAGLADIEYDLELMKDLREKYKNLSIDIQGIVRHVNNVTHKISFEDDDRKKEIASLMDGIKMDNLEAKILTGMDDTEKAAIIFEKWGCRETMVTDPKGVLLRSHGKTYYEKFSNKSSIGRTGRGDTTFAAYLSYRMDYNIADSLKYAAALVSIKMETPGPFAGTNKDVFNRTANNS
jgi:sugar/nucleoside kinase (ribokinase family)